MVTDHLGTPRLMLDQTGSLATVMRHDYLPFGEELFAIGLRTATLGYSSGDGIRQQFTQKERDIETGLDYFLARYYSASQGRFTSPDEFKGGPEELFDDVDPHDPLFYADTAEPQSLNKYHYVLNNPLRYIDPDGHQTTTADRIRNAAASVGRTLVATGNGAINAWGQDNGLPIGGGPENKVGRGIGHVAALVQSAGEIIGGVTAIAGGGGEAGVTAPACATGVGCAVPAVGVATAVGGVAITLHGGFVGFNTLNNVFNKNNSQQNSSANEQKKAEPPKKDQSVEGTRVQRENIESAQKTHRQAGRPDRIRSIEKSRQNEKTALKKIRSLKDAEDH